MISKRPMRLIKYALGLVLMANSIAAEYDPVDMTTVVNNNRFALELYAQLKSDDNLAFSPYCISTVMAMAYAGANANTANQIAQVLHFPAQNLHENFQQLQEQINHRQSNLEMNIANALWGQQGYNFLTEFKNKLKNHYQSELQQIDFATNYENAHNEINSWVEEKTTIKKLIKPGIIKQLTRLVLINAIYFKGQWVIPFKPSVPAPFWLTAKDSIEVAMMKQKGYFSYVSNDAVEILELPYVGGISMLVILPKQSLAKVEGLLNKRLDNWLSHLHSQQVKVYLPKFKITANFELAKTLSTMGMEDVFDNRADFSGMNGTKELYLSAVIHQAFVEVNETGTEAAAATGAVFNTRGITPVVPKFQADHPFIFIIRHNSSNSILFMGRVVNPS